VGVWLMHDDGLIHQVAYHGRSTQNWGLDSALCSIIRGDAGAVVLLREAWLPLTGGRGSRFMASSFQLRFIRQARKPDTGWAQVLSRWLHPASFSHWAMNL